ncbi:MAG: hypothetical protein HZC29_02970, partial [Thaumarchaeota archaeon]|nr:hypothetical protein [Nitrososphaerota archaeon]
MRSDYCDTCGASGKTDGNYCPAAGTVSGTTCYYGTQSCTGTTCGLSTCTLSAGQICDATHGCLSCKTQGQSCSAASDCCSYYTSGSTCYYSRSCSVTCSFSQCSLSNYCAGTDRCGGSSGDTRYYSGTCSATGCSFSSSNCNCDASDSAGQTYTTGGSCQSSTYTDYCLSSATLREYYVSGSGDSATCSYTDKACSELGSGYTCSNGACIVSGAVCGNSVVESGEACDPQATNSNQCSQTTSTCDYTNRKYCTRDSYGDCSSTCQCTSDSWNCGSAGDTNYCNNCVHCGDNSCNCGETSSTCPGDCPGGAVCSGTITLSLSPTTVAPSGSVTPSSSGLSSCDGKTVYFKKDSCAGTQVSSCTVSGSGCTGASFTAPSTTGSYTYYACVDKNGDSDYSDSGESDPETLTVSTAPPPSCDLTSASITANCNG